jgi:dTDP-4-dehydrorhamnose 3,5-epimerase
LPVRFQATDIVGAFVLELEPYVDERGSFARIWCRDELAAHGLSVELAQSSISRNRRAGTLRGMHLQNAPHQEAKLVRCTRGAIFDVVVDLRRDSETYKDWVGVELEDESGSALYVPEGCAHGFQTLTDETEVMYMISRPYAPEAAAGVRWDDPAFGIEWPDTDVRTISERDLSWPDFGAFEAAPRRQNGS